MCMMVERHARGFQLASTGSSWFGEHMYNIEVPFTFIRYSTEYEQPQAR